MDTYHHKPIKRFGIDGVIYDDSSIARLRYEYERLLMSEMRLSGYAIRLDIEPDFTIEYNSKSENFTFELSLHGIYVGKKKSEWIEGIDGTTVIHTPQSRLNAFSREAASQ
jgi:hypothetical protein